MTDPDQIPAAAPALADAAPAQAHPHADADATVDARAILEELLAAPPAVSAATTCLLGEVVDDRHPTLRGRVRVQLAGSERALWVPTLLNLPVRTHDRVLLIRPANGDEWIVTGVLDGFARRPEPPKASVARVELRPDEAVQVVASEGQPLLELSRGLTGPVVRVLDPDVAVELTGKLAVKAAAIQLEATGGPVTLKASDDVVVQGEVVRLN